jgi:hypothetical protein
LVKGLEQKIPIFFVNRGLQSYWKKDFN